MNTDSSHPAVTALITLADTTPDRLARLYRRLVEAAAADGILDVAYITIGTPVGSLLLAATDKGLVRVVFEREDPDQVLETLGARINARVLHAPGRVAAAAREIGEYFAGHRFSFDLSLDFSLSSGFRRLVQQYLSSIGYGHTRTYKDVAQLVGSPRAVRPVGTACATNQLPVVVPCHRVLRTDGSLGGYIGGLDAKATLLTLEEVAA